MIAGCAGSGSLLQHPIPADISNRAYLPGVPFFAQSSLQCGPASLAMVLQWSGVAVRPDDLATEVYTPAREGSLQSELITGARRHGRLAYPIQGLDSLLMALWEGIPVVVLQNLGLDWLPRWHYAVAVGYDLDEENIVLHTGKIANRTVGLATFLRTWNRADQWGLLVLAPGRIPVCAEEHTYLQAALGLQWAGFPAETLAAFEAATQRWPGSAAVWMTIGNARYALGDATAALSAFEKAAGLDPANGDAFNNMAHILAEQGSLQAAEAAALKAVQLGRPHLDIYKRTLAEIRGRRMDTFRSHSKSKN